MYGIQIDLLSSFQQPAAEPQEEQGNDETYSKLTLTLIIIVAVTLTIVLCLVIVVMCMFRRQRQSVIEKKRLYNPKVLLLFGNI